MAAALLIALAASPASAPARGWQTGFALPGLDGAIADAVFLDGDLVVGGRFEETRHGAPVANVARWNGDAWEPMGEGLDGEVRALHLHGGILYAAGLFTHSGSDPLPHVAAWTGTGWHDLDGGTSHAVLDLATFEGSLVAGGLFVAAGGEPAAKIARWDGSAWSPLGAGLDGAVLTLQPHQGSLHAGGYFTNAGGVEAARIARWDGTSWHPLGEGVNAAVFALTSHGGDLIVGGAFGGVPGSPGHPHVGRWDGSAWHPLGVGIDDWVIALTSWNGELFAGGSTFGPRSFDGSSWTTGSVSAGAPVYGLTVIDGRLAVMGGFDQFRVHDEETRTYYSPGIAVWDGETPMTLGGGVGGRQSFNDLVYDVARYEGDLYLGGSSLSPFGYSYCRSMARYADGAWTCFSPDSPFTLFDFEVWNGELVLGYAGPEVGEIDAHGIARWDGTAFHPFDEQLGTGAEVRALGIHDGALVAGGNLDQTPNPHQDIIRWTGTYWETIGGGLTGAPSDVVYDLIEFGGDLYVAGSFEEVDGQPASNLAHWDGSSWSTLGAGADQRVNALTVHDGHLIAGGRFTAVDDVPAGRVAAFDGISWMPLGDGFLGEVLALGTFEGSLLVGGDLVQGGEDLYLARWTGSEWERFEGGTDDVVTAIEDLGDRVAIGGVFLHVGGLDGIPSSYIGVYEGDVVSVPGDDFLTSPPRPLLHATPTPFASRVELSVRLPRSGPVRLTVHDVTGRQVDTLIDAWQAAGTLRVTWDGRDHDGRRLAPGVYLARLDGMGVEETIRLLRAHR